MARFNWAGGRNLGSRIQWGSCSSVRTFCCRKSLPLHERVQYGSTPRHYVRVGPKTMLKQRTSTHHQVQQPSSWACIKATPGQDCHCRVRHGEQRDRKAPPRPCLCAALSSRSLGFIRRELFASSHDPRPPWKTKRAGGSACALSRIGHAIE